MCPNATAHSAASLDICLDTSPDSCRPMACLRYGLASNPLCASGFECARRVEIRPIFRREGKLHTPRCVNMADMVNADRARSRTFVVTGAASGIGLATARRLLAEGGSVVGADLAAPPDLCPEFRFGTADAPDEAATAALRAAVPDRLDGVVHAAGVAGGGPIHLLERAEWGRGVGINPTG